MNRILITGNAEDILVALSVFNEISGIIQAFNPMKTYKISFTLSLLFILMTGKAQDAKLKAPINGADSLYLKNQAAKYYAPTSSITFTYSSGDINTSAKTNSFKADQPFNIKQINALKAKLKGTYKDADTYLEISKLYMYNYNSEEFTQNITKAIELYKEGIIAKPDSASSYNKLGNACFFYGNYAEAVNQYSIAFKLNPKDSKARYSPVINALYMQDTATTLLLVKRNIAEAPDNPKSYEILPMYYIFDFANKTLNSRNPDSLTKVYNSKTIDELCDLSLLKTAMDTHKGNIQYELMYYITRQCLINIKIGTIDKNPFVDKRNDYFKNPPQDSLELLKIEQFYLSCLKRKDLISKYGIYKWLASLYLVQSDYKKTIHYLNEAIAQKPLSQSFFEYNASGDYDNLANVYLVSGDTLSYEKIIRQKFAIKPGINEIPTDFVVMGRIEFRNKNYEAAKKYALDALNKDQSLQAAYILLALIYIQNNDINMAIKNLDIAYKLNPDEREVFLFEGICFLLKNDAYNAQYCFEKAKRLDVPNIDEVFLNKFFISGEHGGK